MLHGRGNAAREERLAGRLAGAFGRPGPFMAAALVSAILTIVVALALGIVFETVDDYNIMMSLSGEKAGSPYWQLTFYNSVFALLQSWLYDLFPGVQWYSFIELGLIFISNTVFLGLILERCAKSGISWPLTLAAYVLLFCAAFLYPVQRMQFTSTAALLGMASCAAVYSIDNYYDRRALWRRMLLSGALLLLSLLERQTAGVCSILFWVSGLVRLAILTRGGIIEAVGANIRVVGVITMGILVACVTFTACHELVIRFGDNADYSSYDEWRVQYQDYPRPTYDEAVEVYVDAGWTREIYSIATSLTYISPKINEQSFMKIVQSSEMDSARPSLFDAIKSDVSLVVNNKAARSLFCALLAAYVSICVEAYLSRGLSGSAGKLRSILFFGATGAVVLAIVASIAVCLSGRWPLRSFQAIGLPLLACLAMIALELVPPLGDALGCNIVSRGNRGQVIRLSVGPFALTAAFFTLLTVGALFGIECVRETHARDAGSISQMASIERYAAEHPEAVFVHDYSVSNVWNSYDPFRVYNDGLNNLIISGGSYTYSGCYYAQLESNGMTRLTGEELLDENVFYISDADHPNFLQRTLDYMRSEFGDIGVEEVATLSGGAKVYKFKLN